MTMKLAIAGAGGRMGRVLTDVIHATPGCAIVVRGDYEQYSKCSNDVTQIIRENVPLFERSSIDEFYVDFTGMDKFFGCYNYATELRQQIIRETGLPISFGMSLNKTVSKVATGEAKPNNQMQIAAGMEKSFLAPLSIKKIECKK